MRSCKYKADVKLKVCQQLLSAVLWFRRSSGKGGKTRRYPAGAGVSIT